MAQTYMVFMKLFLILLFRESSAFMGYRLMSSSDLFIFLVQICFFNDFISVGVKMKGGGLYLGADTNFSFSAYKLRAKMLDP